LRSIARSFNPLLSLRIDFDKHPLVHVVFFQSSSEFKCPAGPANNCVISTFQSSSEFKHGCGQCTKLYIGRLSILF